jgi:hypothetical protein
MKPSRAILVALCVGGAIFGHTAFAQRGEGRGGLGWGPGTPYAKLFNPNSVTTVSGKVDKVDTVAPMNGMGPGVHLVLSISTGPLSVHLGPAWYLQDQGFQLQAGEQVQVRGSQITFDGQPALIATEVTRGTQMLRLRDASGFPLWSGRGRGRQ